MTHLLMLRDQPPHLPAELDARSALAKAKSPLEGVPVMRLTDDRPGVRRASLMPRYVIPAAAVERVADALEAAGGPQFDHAHGVNAGSILRNISDKPSWPVAVKGQVTLPGFATALRTDKPFVISVMGTAAFQAVLASGVARELSQDVCEVTMTSLAEFFSTRALTNEPPAAIPVVSTRGILEL